MAKTPPQSQAACRPVAPARAATLASLRWRRAPGALRVWVRRSTTSTRARNLAPRTLAGAVASSSMPRPCPRTAQAPLRPRRGPALPTHGAARRSASPRARPRVTLESSRRTRAAAPMRSFSPFRRFPRCLTTRQSSRSPTTWSHSPRSTWQPARRGPSMPGARRTVSNGRRQSVFPSGRRPLLAAPTVRPPTSSVGSGGRGGRWGWLAPRPCRGATLPSMGSSPWATLWL
mmetsp:Transcript_36892/g.92691  ORF Transcript_36892/g.92691 Transcript_36892/m.92691 type:complete len:231 (+) Transcript_36892:698-1390(+)